jgi:hypothetical protein
MKHVNQPLLPTALEIVGEGHGRPYQAYPRTGAPRWLMPAVPRLRRPSANLYTPQRFTGRLLKFFMRSGWLGRPTWIDETKLSTLEQEIAKRLGHDVVHLAIYTGKAGANRKATVQVVSDEGDIVAYAKLSSSARGRGRLSAERATVASLSSIPALERHVPKVLGWFERDETSILLLSPGPEQPAPSRFDPSHAAFLAKLHATSAVDGVLAESTTWSRMQDTYRALVPHLREAWRVRYETSFAHVEHVLREEPFRLTLAHRDYTPWNARRFPDGDLYVFDWESASRRELPGLDRFHFLFMTHVLLKGGVRTRDARRFSDAARTGDVRTRTALFHAYLLDVGLEYHELLHARRGRQDDAVLRQVAQLLDAREAWAP